MRYKNLFDICKSRVAAYSRESLIEVLHYIIYHTLKFVLSISIKLLAKKLHTICKCMINEADTKTFVSLVLDMNDRSISVVSEITE